MKVSARNWILLSIFVGLFLARAWLDRAPRQHPVSRLFPELVAARAQKLVLSSGDGLSELVLQRAEGQWTLPAAQGHPARQALVEVLLDRLSALTDSDQVGSSVEEHAGFGVTDAALVVRIFDEEERVLAGLVQGAAAPRGPGDRGRATYVRPVGDVRVFRAARLEPLTLDRLRWLDGQWHLPEAAALHGLRLQGSELAAPPLEVRPERGWSGLALELLEYARALFFEDVLPKESARPAPALEITLEAAAGASLTLSFGPADPQTGTRLAWRTDEPWLVRFSAAMVNPLIERARSLARKGS